MLTVGSLFSGIGGLELGLEEAGLGPVLWQVEKDAFCRRVLAEHWPAAERYEDVRAVGAAVLRRVDVICGGFPCQDLSVAGRGAGLTGDRSGLWFEYLRIVRELRPRYVVIENVPGLVRRGLDVVVTGLDELGYAVVGTRIAAIDVGALHKRERLALVAYAHGEGRNFGSGQSVVIGGRAEPADGGSALAYSHGARLEERLQQQARGQREAVERSRLPGDAWAAEPAVGRVAHGVPERVAQLRALGNAVVPQVAEVIGRLVLSLEGGLRP